MFDTFRPTVAPRGAAGATIASVAAHGLLALMFAFLFTRDTTPARVAAPPPEMPRLVFLEALGPAGGGGGNPAPAPPRPIEIPRTSPPPRVPIDVPPPIVVAPPPPQWTAPIMTMDAVSLHASGAGSVSLPAPGGGGRGAGAGSGSGDGVGDGANGGFGGGLTRPGAGVDVPVLVREREPAYTAEALRARIQGQVELRAVVLEDGTVGDVAIVKSLDRAYGLDLEAIKAARQWRFLPARQNGQPVRMAVTMFLDFRIN
jgi:protein TonB